MNKTMKTGLVLSALLCASGVSVHAQTSTSTSTATPSSVPTTGTGATGAMGAGVVTGPAGAPMGTSSTTTGTGAVGTVTDQGRMNAQNAQANSVQANPSQPSQQASGGGVFGPPSSPGIFGPTTTVTTDIYGNQQPVAGTIQQVPAQGTMGATGTTGAPATQQNMRSQNPISYDANGQPLPNNLYRQSDLPRSINPIQPSGTNQTQPGAQPSGTVTGR